MVPSLTNEKFGWSGQNETTYIVEWVRWNYVELSDQFKTMTIVEWSNMIFTQNYMTFLGNLACTTELGVQLYYYSSFIINGESNWVVTLKFSTIGCDVMLL